MPLVREANLPLCPPSTAGAGESLIVLPFDALQVSRTIPAPFGRHPDAARLGVH